MSLSDVSIKRSFGEEVRAAGLADERLFAGVSSVEKQKHLIEMENLVEDDFT